MEKKIARARLQDFHVLRDKRTRRKPEKIESENGKRMPQRQDKPRLNQFAYPLNEILLGIYEFVD